MARREKIDRSLAGRLDEFERRLFVLKIEYEKYFSGVIQIEPVRERDDLKRMMREFTRNHITNTRQQFRLRTLRARFSSYELYWTRNMVQIERGTHPKMKFRANMRDRARAEAAAKVNARQQGRQAPARPSQAELEDRAYSAVFDSYIEARGKCGQNTDLAFEAVRDVLRKQVRTIKSRYRCKSVKFRVTVEDGKAKVKAVPLR